MSIRLPLGNAPVKGYQHHAFPLLISSLHPDFFQWFYCNYIQLISTKNIRAKTEFNFNFYDFPSLKTKSPFLGEMYIPKSLIERYVNPLQFLIDSLEDKHYIVAFVDEFYIPDRVAYQKKHFIHDILIYGYDDYQKIFNVAGYNEKGVLDYSDVGFRNLEKAFKISLATGGLAKWGDSMHLLQLKSENRYSFDINIFIDLIEEYLFSTDSSYKFRMYENKVDSTYGLDTYNSLINYLLNIKEKIDIRVFHILYEHKKSMVSRLHFLKDELGIPINPKILFEYLDIEKKSLITRNLSLKYEIKRQDNIKDNTISKMIQILIEIKGRENDLLNVLINDLKKYKEASPLPLKQIQ